MVKIESKKLAEFISVATLDARFESVVLDFRDNGLYVQSKDGSNTIMNLVDMPSSAFEEYKAYKNPVGIKSSSMLLNILKSFNSIINLDITKDLITIYTEKKSASLKTANIIYLDTNYVESIPPIFEKFDEGVDVNSDILKNTVKNIGIVKSDNVSIKFKNNILTLETGDNNFDKISEKVECEYNDVQSNYNSELFKTVIKVLNGDINLSIPRDGLPVQLSLKSENLNARLLIAPNNSPAPEEEVKVEDIKKDKVSTDTSIDDLVEDMESDMESVESIDVDDNLL